MRYILTGLVSLAVTLAPHSPVQKTDCVGWTWIAGELFTATDGCHPIHPHDGDDTGCTVGDCLDLTRTPNHWWWPF